MEEYFQSPSPSVSSRRILYTASSFAKSNLIFLQETGSLKALRPHVSRRDNLQSYLCMMVLDGSGYIEYEGRHYDMKKGIVRLLTVCEATATAQGRMCGHSSGCIFTAKICRQYMKSILSAAVCRCSHLKMVKGMRIFFLICTI